MSKQHSNIVERIVKLVAFDNVASNSFDIVAGMDGALDLFPYT